MKPIDIILLVIIAIVLALAVISLIRRQRKGGGCCNCPGSSTCGRSKERSCESESCYKIIDKMNETMYLQNRSTNGVRK